MVASFGGQLHVNCILWLGFSFVNSHCRLIIIQGATKTSDQTATANSTRKNGQKALYTRLAYF